MINLFGFASIGMQPIREPKVTDMNAEQFLIKTDRLKADSGDMLQLFDADGQRIITIRREGYKNGSYMVLETKPLTIVYDYAEPRANGDAVVLKNRTASMEIESLVGIIDLRSIKELGEPVRNSIAHVPSPPSEVM